MATLLAALALFPASCGVTSHGVPRVLQRATGGWQVTSCVFTKRGAYQTGIQKVQFVPQPCRMLPVTKLSQWPR